jgi:hypothetical protein
LSSARLDYDIVQLRELAAEPLVVQSHCGGLQRHFKQQTGRQQQQKQVGRT